MGIRRLVPVVLYASTLFAGSGASPTPQDAAPVRRDPGSFMDAFMDELAGQGEGIPTEEGAPPPDETSPAPYKASPPPEEPPPAPENARRAPEDTPPADGETPASERATPPPQGSGGSFMDAFMDGVSHLANASPTDEATPPPEDETPPPEDENPETEEATPETEKATPAPEGSGGSFMDVVMERVSQVANASPTDEATPTSEEETVESEEASETAGIKCDDISIQSFRSNRIAKEIWDKSGAGVIADEYIEDFGIENWVQNLDQNIFHDKASVSTRWTCRDYDNECNLGSKECSKWPCHGAYNWDDQKINHLSY